MRFIAGLILSVQVCVMSAGCSLYQSPGREFLEKQAYEFAGVAAQAHLLGCEARAHQDPEWVLMQESGEAKLFAFEGGGFELRVFPSAAHSDFGCDFRFASAQEMFEKTAAAIELSELYLSLGGFAFHPISPVK